MLIRMGETVTVRRLSTRVQVPPVLFVSRKKSPIGLSLSRYRFCRRHTHTHTPPHLHTADFSPNHVSGFVISEIQSLIHRPNRWIVDAQQQQRPHNDPQQRPKLDLYPAIGNSRVSFRCFIAPFGPLYGF